MRICRARKRDLYAENRDAVARENAYLLKRIAFCAALNMILLSVLSPFFDGFKSSAPLYYVSASLVTAFGVFCAVFLDRCLKAVKTLYYLFLAALAAYAIALSCFFYPDIHGVTIIGIFMLIPIVILDKSWRANLIFSGYYLASCYFAFTRKSYALAVDDCLTCGCFTIFGMLIGNYIRATRMGAIERQARLDRQRCLDELTGLPNRRGLFETLAETAGENVCVIMLDIDYFKPYNDTYGHQEGDRCLRALGELFARIAREQDAQLYRYGGEEFLCLCRAADEARLRALAERLVSEVRDIKLQAGRVTASAGYACGAAGETSEETIRRADDALYLAKAEGRDRARGASASTAAS